jgi:hypothetical protein
MDEDIEARPYKIAIKGQYETASGQRTPLADVSCGDASPIAVTLFQIWYWYNERPTWAGPDFAPPLPIQTP